MLPDDAVDRLGRLRLAIVWDQMSSTERQWVFEQLPELYAAIELWTRSVR